MFTRQTVTMSAPLMSKSTGVVRTQPAPLDALAQRPRVLTSAATAPRQLSLFARQGALR